MKSATRPKATVRKVPSKNRVGGPTDPVHVYLRLRPMQNKHDSACIKVVSDTSVQCSCPESSANYRLGNTKEVVYTFTKVFDEKVGQKEVFDVVAMPLVEALLTGRNGLLFTYGVTGSGKTYTMTGEPSDGGVMPRCLDIIFNSITDFQAKKFVFKPDRLNGFDVQSDFDALQDRQQELLQQVKQQETVQQYNGRFPKTPRPNSASSDAQKRSPDPGRIEAIDEDNAFAVFVTYVEIYNNNVYDLLEEVPEDILRNKPLQCKIIREDSVHNMFVHGVVEVEVKSPEEAFEAFYRGQRKKRMANTVLNAESSRSHSVFTIRLVQAPLDRNGENVEADKRGIVVSQLSLVDLAGCERTSRTKNSGKKVLEAGHINNSLMSLRACLEILRENQTSQTNKMVPYRDSKLTHLFKNYLDGEGQVRMIVCANPRSDDYDETLQVMKFAEMSQEVQIARPTVNRVDLGFTPGRRLANQMFKDAVNQLGSNGNLAGVRIPVDVDLVFSLEPDFPALDITGSDGARVLENLKSFLKERVEKRNKLCTELTARFERFRPVLMELERDKIMAKQDAAALQVTLEQERSRMSMLTTRAAQAETEVGVLRRKLAELENTCELLKQENADLSMALTQREMNTEKLKLRCQSKVAIESEKANQLERQLREKNRELMSQTRDTHVLSKVRRLLDDNGSVSSYTPASSKPVSNMSCRSEATPRLPPSETRTVSSSRRMGVSVRPRHRRSKSAEGGRWLDHCPATPAPLNTILQPSMKKRKSITKLTDVKDVTTGAAHYCLTTQDQDSAGEVETRLYKGDVVHTISGGAQVIFNDVELLKQTSPTGEAASRKRPALSTDVDVAERCALALEGHPKRPHLLRSSSKH